MMGEKYISIEQQILKTAYRCPTANFEYVDVISLMKREPNTRGKSRNVFQAKDGKKCDIYELTIKSITENPPIVRLEFQCVFK